MSQKLYWPSVRTALMKGLVTGLIWMIFLCHGLTLCLIQQQFRILTYENTRKNCRLRSLYYWYWPLRKVVCITVFGCFIVNKKIWCSRNRTSTLNKWQKFTLIRGTSLSLMGMSMSELTLDPCKWGVDSRAKITANERCQWEIFSTSESMKILTSLFPGRVYCCIAV